MTLHMQKEIEKLKIDLLKLCGLVEQSLWHAVKSISERDAKLAKEVIDNDISIDRKEVGIEEECLKLLALYQPVAADLRFIITSLKINNDLERIADLAVNIAERSVFLANQPAVNVAFDFETMAEKTQKMLRNSLDALVNLDLRLAHTVCADDDEIDAINRQMYDTTKQAILKHPEQVDVLIHLLSISRHLERIADHTTNIAEDVIYMISGEIIRHRVNTK